MTVCKTPIPEPPRNPYESGNSDLKNTINQSAESIYVLPAVCTKVKIIKWCCDWIKTTINRKKKYYRETLCGSYAEMVVRVEKK